MSTAFDELAYIARQGTRVAWYMGHYFVAERQRSERPQTASPSGRSLTRGKVMSDLFALFREDFRNVERGHYPVPRDHDGTLGTLLRQSRDFFADVPQVARRRKEHGEKEIYEDKLRAHLPEYFLQNFHYQTGGYLTEESARLYDMQVEVLFSGSANAMRRQCLVPVARYIRGKDQRTLKLLDVACGTGRFLRFVKEAFPRLKVEGVDLSGAYLEEARKHIEPYRVALRVANAEVLPFERESFDIVSSIYLFHELPPEARRGAAAEFARVLKPKGELVFMDSLQLGDLPDYDGLLERFPLSFHEPYFASYLREDLNTLFADSGLDLVSSTPHFLSKRVVCAKRS